MFGLGICQSFIHSLGHVDGAIGDYLNSLQGAVGLVTVFFVIGIVLLASQDLSGSPEPS